MRGSATPLARQKVQSGLDQYFGVGAGVQHVRRDHKIEARRNWWFR